MIEQIDDQFQLVHALEVGDLRLIARLDERVEAGFDERGHTPAEHGLLAEEIRLGLFGERRLQDAGACTAKPLGIGERVGESATGRVLVHRDQGRYASPLHEHLAHAMAGRFRRDHTDVDVRRRDDLAVTHIEAVREHERLSGLHVRCDLLLVQLGLHRVGREDHDYLGRAGGVGHREHR